MNHPLVRHIKDEHDVYIGRGSKWGNPFVIHVDGTRSEVIQKYKEWILTQPQLIASLKEIKGKRLGCFCTPKPCHGDILAKMANDESSIDDLFH